MRAYRARQRERTARLVDPADAPEAVAEVRPLRERIDELAGERDRLWAQVVRLQDHIRDLERCGADQPPVPSTSDQPRSLSRAERRRLELAAQNSLFSCPLARRRRVDVEP
jgi:hypothetical protein